jgi:hypothetical protein
MPRRLPALIPGCFLLALCTATDVTAQQTPVFAGRDEIAWEYRIREALRRPVTMQFQEAPLGEVLAEFERQIQIPIVIDVRALEDSGLDGETPVTVQCERVAARQVLDLMLQNLQLGWYGKHRLVVTTREGHDEELLVRVYPVADFLVDSGNGDFSQGEGFGPLIETIGSTVAAETWDFVGGQGSIRLVPAAGAMAVSQTREVHEELEHLLYALRAARYSQGLSPHGPEDVLRPEHQRMFEQHSRPETRSSSLSQQREPVFAPPVTVQTWQQPRRHE